MKRRNPTAGTELYAAILQLQTVEDCTAFFRDLCTPAEREAFIDRWRVAKLLDQGMPYREIADRTGVSVTTVTRVARCMHDNSDGYKKIIERMKGTT